MPKSNNDENWPHQKFHNANKSTNESSSLIWESRSYQYDNLAKIKEINYKWGSGATNSPRLCEPKFQVSHMRAPTKFKKPM